MKCPVCRRKVQINPRNVEVVRKHRTWVNDICPMSGQKWPETLGGN